MDCIYLFLLCIFFKLFFMPSLSTGFRQCTDAFKSSSTLESESTILFEHYKTTKRTVALFA
jgi:hypothetical protein